MDIDTAPGVGVAFATGVLLHMSLFRVGEWDLLATWLIRAPFILLAVLSAVLARLRPEESILRSLKDAGKVDAALLGGVFTSMLVYRAFLHRLRSFPGPFAARLSNFYMTKHAVQTMQIYRHITSLHERYGDFVRVGPMEISIIEPAAFRDIYANSSPCEKGPVYSHGHPSTTVLEARSRKQHAPKRKPWDRAFTTQALNDYEEKVGRHTNQLLDRIEEYKGSSFDIRRWFSFYTFDVMGELAFGNSFRQLEDNVEHYMSVVAHENQRMTGGILLFHAWCLEPMKRTPILNWTWLDLQKWSSEQIDNRMVNEPEVPDIFHWVSSEYRNNPKPTRLDRLNLLAEIRLIVIAGSDTTAMTLVGLFYHLVKYPKVLAKLRSEIDELAAQGDQPLTKNTSLAKLRYLQACIDESLRLFPVVPTRLQRMTPPEGAQIGSRWVPGNTCVIAPSWILCRGSERMKVLLDMVLNCYDPPQDPRSFVRPDEFIPERWTSQPDLVLDDSVYAPFSVGRTSCAGKQLALMELRRAASQILHRYDFALAPGQQIDAFERGLEDHFTHNPPEFKLVFKPRKTPSHASG